MIFIELKPIFFTFMHSASILQKTCLWNWRLMNHFQCPKQHIKVLLCLVKRGWLLNQFQEISENLLEKDLLNKFEIILLHPICCLLHPKICFEPSQYCYSYLIWFKYFSFSFFHLSWLAIISITNLHSLDNG